MGIIANRRLPISIFELLVLLLCVAPMADAQIPRIALQPFATGLSAPLFLTNAKDGTDRRFIVEQPGRIRVMQPGSTVPTIFLDITSRVVSGGERGLLGLAFHPAFASNGRFYVDYTRQPDGATVVAEYRVSVGNPNVASSTETILFVIPQPFENHNGGMVAFGPDGLLYVGMGDGGSANDPGNRAQNLNALLGKILRIDVDHPQAGPAIFAYGFRNPWRFSFDRLTGMLWVGDVGQDTREEVDIVVQGGNYGWRVWEGTLCTNLGPAPCSTPGFIPPVTDYGHTGGRCSITGGYIYRGVQGSLPYGAYVFGDYCTGEIMMYWNGVQSVLLDTNLDISSFGEDESGEVYVVGLSAGSILHITNPDGVQTSTRSFSVTDNTASVASTTGSSGSLTTGFARIHANAGSAPPGFAIAALQQRGVLISETTIPASIPITDGRIFAEVGGRVSTGLAVTNPDGRDATVSFYFTDAGGNNFGQGSFFLPAGQRIAAFLSEAPFNGGSSILGSFTFQSTVPVAAIALRGITNERAEFLMAPVPIVDLTSNSSDPVRMAYYTQGAGWTTEAVLVNPSSDPLSGDITFFTPQGQIVSVQGYTLPPQSAVGIQPPASSALATGSIQVTPRSSKTPGAFCIFTYTAGGVAVTEASVLATKAESAFRAYVDSVGTIRSGVALTNPSLSPVTVDLDLAGLSASVTIPANGEQALFLDEIFGAGALPSSFQGVLRVTSSSPIAIVMLRTRVNERGDFLITTTPPVPDSAPTATDMVFAHFAEGGGYSMQFIVFGRTASGTMDFSMPLLFR